MTIERQNIHCILNRIESYLLKFKHEIKASNTNLHLTHYRKIYKLFLFDDGMVDMESIDVLRTLCQKKGINEYFEVECDIRFQMNGVKREIGLKVASSRLNYVSKEYLLVLKTPTSSITSSAPAILLPAATNILKKKRISYIIHRDTGTIITSQHKAWNDKVRMAMSIDLILKPEALKRGGKLFLWQDNCAVHKQTCLDRIYDDANVQADYLPPNMTYILQVH